MTVLLSPAANWTVCAVVSRASIDRSGASGYSPPRRGVAQLGSAPALGAGCRRFESYRPDQLINKLGHFLRWPYSTTRFLSTTAGFWALGRDTSTDVYS
uniref:Uncharacterized protein n=1 Tax=mine drainage metagenome TaxID=410659 RepID=E6QBI4_9ZZZZ